ncbi:MAG: T9SS type A sorting domain-containing protein [Lewinellaceae bacterium]|nr:T9SS type A sorting domain-containing protein [Phaeodactylibacter sp.]MCB9039889.1 T9SS type A sorting domain-containing protein [Lewinellaceae bacterium]
MKTLFTTLFAFVLVFAFGQTSVRPIDLVQSAQVEGAAFSPVQLFQAAPGAVLAGEKAPKAYDVLDISQYELEQLLQDEPQSITLSLPAHFRPAPIEVLLVKVNPFAEDFSVRTSDGRTLTGADIELGIHYRGTVKGESAIAAFSFFSHDVMGMVSTKGEGNLVIGKLEDSRNAGRYVIYQDRDVLQDLGFSCETMDDGIGYTRDQLEPQPGTRALSDCVGLYFEVDDDVVTDKGGAAGATNYVTGVYNQVATLYANESINTVVTQIFAWTTNSPYSSTSSSGMLSQFQGYWGSSGSWPGALGQLLSYQASGGIAAGFSGICASDRRNSQSFSSINSTYSNFPTYSWTVMVVTHEFGHTFGSRHTHACVWNGNNTAIDGCSGSTEGSCSLPGYPSQGGTIMSYCHLQSVGINFNEGFGPQPGNVIRNVISNAGCLAPCGPPSCEDGFQNGNETGVDCGGPDCPACPTCSDGIQNGDETGVDCGGSFCPVCPCYDNPVTLTIILDNYPEETRWEIRDGGTVLASGGTYGSYPDGSTVVENACLPDGCYDFVIYDSYGDGICCSYGIGSYTLTDDSDGSTLASGGAFGSSETTNFCVSLGGGPTCTDGIQNGSETGVDCGGTCPPCPTCNDGIQNGDETGVDCGGSSCPACPTCTDGIQNGDESGVDCGGSCPNPCPVNCDVPTGLSASPAQTEATLTWSAASGANDYNVRAREVGTSTWTNGYNLTSPVSYTGLTCETNYEFQVQSNCTGATSAWSSLYTFSTTSCGGGGCTYVSVDFNNFDSGWGIWNDGGSDAGIYSTSYAYSAPNCVRLRDNSSSSVVTTDNLNLASYDELTVNFTYVPVSMDNSNEDFWLQVSTNGGSSYTTVEEWNLNDEFQNDVRYFESVVIPGSFSSNTRLRFRCDASGNSDWVYIDDVEILGCANGALVDPGDGPKLVGVKSADLEVDAPHAHDSHADVQPLTAMKLFPNPVTNELTVSFILPDAMPVQLFVTDLNGKVVNRQPLNGDAGRQEAKVDASRMAPGVYFVHLVSQGAKLTKKFVVVR